MSKSRLRAILISDFNLGNLAAILANSPEPPALQVELAPFGQVRQALSNPQLELWQTPADLTVVWVRPQSIIEEYAARLRAEPVDLALMLSQVDQFADQLLSIRERAGHILVASWCTTDVSTAPGLRDLDPDTGISALLMRMNLRLTERLKSATNIFMLDAERWFRAAGNQAFSPKLWYLAKQPFGQTVISEAARSITAAVSTLAGNSRKLIIVDLDNTLWGGIVGDLGWETLVLGGHDPIGEAYRDFQVALLILKRRGVLLAIVSKNEEPVALEAIARHPEMILRQSDFVAWRINWEDKAANVAALVASLNLGLQSTVFLDDNPVERARVRETLPEVLVPDLPEDKMLYRNCLASLRCFDQAALSAEDRVRTEMYHSERERASLKDQIGSLDRWLETLETVVLVEVPKPENLNRMIQLLNKTNQMNLSTRRMSEAEMTSWLQHPDRSLRTMRVSDRFGDSGLTGIISWEIQGDQLGIVDFVLSCRVMGRKVEETMLYLAIEAARARRLKSVRVSYMPTAKNAPCLRFLEQAGLRPAEGGRTFLWDCSESYPQPLGISIQWIETDTMA